MVSASSQAGLPGGVGSARATLLSGALSEGPCCLCFLPGWPTTSVAPLGGLGPSRIFLFGTVSSRAADDFGRAASVLASPFKFLFGEESFQGPQILVAPTSRTGSSSPAVGDFAGVTSARRRRALKLPST